MSAQPGERATSLIVFYLLFFMTVGITLPFLPGYFSALGFSGTQAGALLAIGPAFTLLMPPMWGQVADRLGRPGLVLFIATTGGAAGFALLSLASTFATTLAAMCLYATFASSMTSLADSQALQHVSKHGGSYSAIRRWGSVGFVLTSLPFGLLVSQVDRRAVLVPLLLFVLAAVVCGLTLARQPAESHLGPKPGARAALKLASTPAMALFLLGTCLHWVAFAPYNGSLAPHLRALGLSPAVIGLCSSVGVISEILVMVTWPRWGARLPTRTVLIACFLLSSLRWGIMAVTSQPAVLVTVSALHGITFGAFYLSSVAWMLERTPPSLRATGQSLFASATFGIGGIIGYAGSGALYDALGGHRLFGLASALSLLPALVVALTPRATQPLRVPDE